MYCENSIIPPQSIEAEQSVIGSMLIDKETIPVVTGILTPDDFYRSDHQEIYRAMLALDLRKQPIDLITVSEWLKIKGSLDMVGGIEYLTNIATTVPTTANVTHYASMVKTASVKRQIIKGCHDVINITTRQIFDSDIDLKNAVMERLDIPISERTLNHDMGSILVECLNGIQKKYETKSDDKLYTEFPYLDRVTAGFHPQELTIIAARPGVGKTAFALQLMLNLSKKGNYSLFVSREMSSVQICTRILSNITSIDGQKLRFCKNLHDDDWMKIGKSVGHITELPIEINDKLASIQEIRAYCRELRNKGRLDILFIDYIGLLKTLKRCDSRRSEIEDISRQCKELSLEFEIPVIVLSQLNRENVRDGREPKLFDLRESGAIEQDADNVLFLHVPTDTDEAADCFDIKVIIAKQRNGPTGYVLLKYYRRTFRFYGKGG